MAALSLRHKSRTLGTKSWTVVGKCAFCPLRCFGFSCSARICLIFWVTLWRVKISDTELTRLFVRWENALVSVFSFYANGVSKSGTKIQKSPNMCKYRTHLYYDNYVNDVTAPNVWQKRRHGPAEGGKAPFSLPINPVLPSSWCSAPVRAGATARRNGAEHGNRSAPDDARVARHVLFVLGVARVDERRRRTVDHLRAVHQTTAAAVDAADVRSRRAQVRSRQCRWGPNVCWLCT